MPVKLETQKEKTPNVLPVNGKTLVVDENIPEKESKPEKEQTGPNSVESLFYRNLNAKKILADELSDMGLSADEILRILHLER